MVSTSLKVKDYTLNLYLCCAMQMHCKMRNLKNKTLCSGKIQTVKEIKTHKIQGKEILEFFEVENLGVD